MRDERDARQVDADEKWDAEQRLVARMERQRKLFEQRMGIGGPQ